MAGLRIWTNFRLVLGIGLVMGLWSAKVSHAEMTSLFCRMLIICHIISSNHFIDHFDAELNTSGTCNIRTYYNPRAE